MTPTAVVARTLRENGISAGKSAVAAVVAWVAADNLVTAGPEFYAPLVAVLSVHPTVIRTLRDSAQRLVAVGIGLALGFAVSTTVGLHWWTLGAGLAVAVLASRWHRLGDEGVQVPVAALLVLLLAEHPTIYAQHLIVEGVIGAVSAAVVNVAVLPPVHTGTAHRALDDLRRAVVRELEDLALAVTGRAGSPERIGPGAELDRLLESARDAVRTSQESTVLNPRGLRARGVPGSQRRSLAVLEQVSSLVRDVAVALEEAGEARSGPDACRPDLRSALAEQLRGLADGLGTTEVPDRTARSAAGQLADDTLVQTRAFHRRLEQLSGDRPPELLLEAALLATTARTVHGLRRVTDPSLRSTAPGPSRS